MLLLPMHPSLCSAYRHYHAEAERTYINSQDYKELEDFLINLIASNLLECKTTLILLPDVEDASWPSKILATYGLSQHCLVWTNEFLDQQKPLERIKTFAALPEIEFDQDHHRVLSNMVDDTASILTEYIHQLYRPVFGKYTWKDLLHMNLKIASEDETSEVINMSDTQRDLDVSDFISQIGKAEKEFTNKYILLNNIHLFNPEIYKDEEASEMILEELQVMLEDIKEIRSLYNSYHSSLRKDVRNKIEIEYLQIANLHLRLKKCEKRLQLRCSERQPEMIKIAGLLSPKELDQTDELLNELKVIIEQSDEYDIAYLKGGLRNCTLLDFNEFLQSIGNHTENFQQNVNNATDFQMRRIGPFNLEDERIIFLEKRLDAFINKLNQSRIFARTYLNNSLHLDHKMTLIKEMEQDIHRGIVFLEVYADYHKWRCSLGNEEVANVVLQELTYSSEPWKAAVKQNLIRQGVSSVYHPYIAGIPGEVENLLKLQGEWYHLELDRIQWLRYEARSSAAELLKSKNNYLHEELFSDSVVNSRSTSVVQLFISEPDLFSSFFPVVCTSARYVYDLVEQSRRKWDCIINLSDSIDSKILDRIAPLANQFIIHRNDSIPNKDDQDETHFDLPVPNIGTVRELKYISITNRHHEALKIAQLLLDQVLDVSIYRVKNVSIISTLPKAIEEQICSQFIPQGIKCLHDQTSDTLELTETLVEDENVIYFLHENELLSHDIENGFRYHQDLLKTIRNAGMSPISINSSELYTDPIQVIKTVRQTILASIMVQEKKIKESEHVAI